MKIVILSNSNKKGIKYIFVPICYFYINNIEMKTRKIPIDYE